MSIFSFHKIALFNLYLFAGVLLVQAQTNSYSLHKIKKGETLSTIAKTNKTTVAELMHLNNLTAKSVLKLGKNIKVPVKQVQTVVTETIATPAAVSTTAIIDKSDTTEPFPKYREHIIKPKESFSLIARQNETTVAEIMKLNGLNTKSVLKPGDTIKIPIKDAPMTPPIETMTTLEKPVSETEQTINYTEHIIKPKETLSSIAKENHTTIGAIMRLNGMNTKSILKDGTRLKIPNNATVTTVEVPVARKQTPEIIIPQQPAYTTHIIRPKETLLSLAKNNHTTIRAIMDLNDMKAKHPLKRGESIKIPAKSVPLAGTKASTEALPNTTTQEPNYTEHIIKAEETLSSIAKANHTTVGDIMRLNGMNTKSVLKDGAILRLPALGVKATEVPTAVMPNSGSVVKATDSNKTIKAAMPTLITTTRPIRYIVNKKDNLYKISKQFKTTQAQLKEWNGMTDDKIKPGMGLIVGQETVTVPTPNATIDTALAKSTIQKKRPTFPYATQLAKDSTRVAKDSLPTSSYQPVVDSSINPITKNVHESIDGNQALDIVDPSPIPKYAKYAEKEGFYAGYFDRKHLSDNTTTGDAAPFKSTSGWEDKKYYILINDINQGAIVHITYNDKSICAKVMGPLPPVKEDIGLVARISTSAVEALGVQDLVKFGVTINY